MHFYIVAISGDNDLPNPLNDYQSIFYAARINTEGLEHPVSEQTSFRVEIDDQTFWVQFTVWPCSNYKRADVTPLHLVVLGKSILGIYPEGTTSPLNELLTRLHSHLKELGGSAEEVDYKRSDRMTSLYHIPLECIVGSEALSNALQKG